MDINEYNKYRNDKIKFAEKFFRLYNPNNSTVLRTKLYDFQKVILACDDFLLIRKERQVGESQAIAFEIAYHLNYTPNFNMLMLSPNKSTLYEIKSKIQRHFSNIPDNIRIPLKSSLKNVIESNINSSIEFRNGNPNNFVRSQTYDAIYIEEADYINDFENSYQILLTCLSKHGKMVIGCTPTLSGSKFEKLWKSKNKFNKLMVDSVTYNYISANKKTLNSLSKTQYDNIIRECVIL